MTIETNTFLTFSAVGNREDLADVIYNISPTETPFQAAVKTTKSSAILHEWQIDALDSAAGNAALEGDEFSATAVTPTSRPSNRCQISTKEIIVSGSQIAANPAGRSKEIIYQTTKSSNALKRDVEFVLLNNQAPVTGNATTARQLRPLLSWYSTNVSDGGGAAANGSASTARTAGTARAFTVTMLLNMFETVWTAGGEGGLVLCSGAKKRAISGFDLGVVKHDVSEDKKATTTVSIIVSDFGDHKVVADRFARSADVHVLTPSLLKIADYRPMQTMDIAKTGDAEKGKVLREYTLENCNEAAHGLITDLS